MHISPEKVSFKMNSNGDGGDDGLPTGAAVGAAQLLFFDTFSHEAVELNLDLVQFPSPVIVEEIRVIPLGGRVPFPGGSVRLGATNPTMFQLEFFVNDLSKPGASTFESLGTLHYNQSHQIQLQTRRFIPTDGLVLRGMYNAITLSVYGTLSKSTAEQLALQAGNAAAANQQQHQDNLTLASEERHEQHHASTPLDTHYLQQQQHLLPPRGAGPWLMNEEAADPNRSWGPSVGTNSNHYSGQSHPVRLDNSLVNGRGLDLSRGPRAPSHDRSKSPSSDHGHHLSRLMSPNAGGALQQEHYFRPRSVTPAVDQQQPVHSLRISPGIPQGGEVHVAKDELFEEMSDISDGDIPEVMDESMENPESPTPATALPEAPMQPPPSSQDEKKESSSVLVGKQEVDDLMEEISDEEAEWSDDGGGFLTPDLDVEFEEEWEDLVKVFDIVSAEVPKVPASKTLCMEKIQAVRTALADCVQRECSSEWIEKLEEATALLQDDCDGGSDDTDELLWTCACKSLDFNLAVQHETPTDKVRHIKLGLKFVKSTAKFSPEVFERLLLQGLQSNLLRVVSEKSMAHSIKLAALQILDESLSTGVGVNIFIGRTTIDSLGSFLDLDHHKPDVTLYAQLISLLETAPSRLKQSLVGIVYKIHFYEVCRLFELQTSKIESNDVFDVADTDSVCDTIAEISRSFQTAACTISQPLKLLPVCFTFQPPDTLHFDPYPGIFQTFAACHLLESLHLLLSRAEVPKKVWQAACALLDLIVEQKGGVRFLCCQDKAANNLLRLLFSTSEEEDYPVDLAMKISLSSNAFSTAEGLNIISSHQAASQSTVEHLQTLYGMTFAVNGRLALVKILREEGYVRTLIQLARSWSSGEGELPEEDQFNLRAAVQRYALDLLLIVVRTSEMVEPLKHNIDELKLLVAELDGQNLSELSSWIQPISEASNLAKLCEVVKKNVENLSPVSLELITAARLILNHCEGTDIHQLSRQQQQEAIISVHSCSLMEHYASILGKICSAHEQPSLHTATFAGNSGFLLLSVIRPVVRTFRLYLRFAISSRGSDFKDTSSVSAMLRIFTLTSEVPPASVCHRLSQEIGEDIVDLLSLFTMPILNLPNHNGIANCWTLMFGELVDYSMLLPHTFCSGLRLLSELLPLPLPLPAKEDLTREERTVISNSRKLWSAYVLHLDAKIRTLIRQMLGVSNGKLMGLLKRVMVQLADLSPATSIMVGEEITARLHDVLKVGSVGQVRHLLGLVAWMVETPCIKAALLHLVSEQVEESGLIGALSKLLLLNEGVENGGQEQAVSILQALCDPEISLLEVRTKENKPVTVNVIASLPKRVILDQMLSVVLTQLALPEQSHSTAGVSVLCLRTLSLVAEHGLPYLVDNVMKFPHALPATVQKMSSSNQTDFLAILAAFLEVFHPLWDDETPNSHRATIHQLLQTIEVPSTEGEEVEASKHPFLKLIEKLASLEEEDMEYKQQLHQQLDCVARLFEARDTAPAASAEVEIFAEPLLLPELFNQRQFVSFEMPDNVKFHHRSSTPSPPDDICERSGTEVKLDLVEISEAYFSKEYDIAVAIKQVCEEKSLERDQTKKVISKKTALERKVLQTKSLISSYRAGGAMAIRGRGGGFGHRMGHQRPDGFRSRPPNTSRPPSLHVDDFLLLQQRGQQPTGPTGYNKQSIKAAKELFAQREAEQVKGSIVGYREATKEPVYSGNGRSSTSSRRGGGGGAGPGGRPSEKQSPSPSTRGGGGSSRSVRDRGSSGWSPLQPGGEGSDRRKWISERRVGSSGTSSGTLNKDKRKSGGRDERSRHPRSLPR